MTIPMEQYRAALAELAAYDRVAQVDGQVDALWQQACETYGPGLDDQQFAMLPVVVAPDLAAPVELDVDRQLHQIQRLLGGLPPELPRDRWLNSARRVLALWLAACLVIAVLLGTTVTGLTVVPAFFPAMVVGGVLLLTGPGRLPGWIWAVGPASLSLFLLSGSPPSDHSPLPVSPQWFLGVLFVLLTLGFARSLQLAGRERLARKQAVTRAQELANERRPLEFALALALFGSMTAGAGIAVLVIITTVGALLRRRRWTSAVACLTAVLTLMVTIRDASKGYDADWAHPIVIAALAALWAVAVIHEPWRHRLSRTERILSAAGRTAAAGYRAAENSMGAGLSGLAPRPVVQQPVAQPPAASKYPKGQFGRYCINCAGTTAHASRGGFSQPQCIQCGSKAAGGSSGDRNYPDYCSSCNSTTPHTSKGCVVCAGGH